MKQYRYIISLCLFAVLFSGCLNDDYLEKSPKLTLTPETGFVNYNNFKTYAWNLYDVFPGYTDNEPNPMMYKFDWWGGFLIHSDGNGQSPWAYQTVTETDQSSDWKFDYIRKVNVMLDHIDQSAMSSTEKEHWRSVGYFFRAMRYYDMLTKFGDVIWLNHELKTTDTDLLYAARNPRSEVADSMLANLKYAELHIIAGGDGNNTINVHCVRALLSRFGLFEGTWRKYHKLGDADKFLEASISASEKLIGSFPVLHSNYNELFNSVDLSNKPGIILFKPYMVDMFQNQTRYSRTSEIRYELSQSTLNMYLCSDGTVIKNTRPDDIQDTYNQFRNRDRRLYYTVCPPYRVNIKDVVPNGAWQYWKVGEKIPTGTAKELVVTVADSMRYREFIDFMAALPGNTTVEKRLPAANWEERPIKSMPHFRNYTEGQGYLASSGGFLIWKMYNRHVSPTLGNKNEEDAPVFRMGEILVNHAEAMYEMGRFDQSVADLTINKLRARAGVAPMNVSAIDANFDPDRDSEVAPVLWEIRRERRTELMAEGFAFNDIRRWKEAEFYINKPQLGMYADNALYGNQLVIYPNTNAAASANQVGHIVYPVNPPVGWLEHYYLFPLPMDQLAQNKNLKQNPGYQSPASGETGK